MSIRHLTLQIEGLRTEMIRVAEFKGNLTDPQVIALSQQLDTLLVTMQRLKRKKCSGPTHWCADQRRQSSV